MKPLAPNTLIQNRYLIVQLVGKGGMGEVYLAVDQRLGSAVALKRTFFASDEMLGIAFEREARTLARLRHPVLPKVSDHFSENSEQYLVMEHIAGDDLSKRLEAAQKPFPLSWVMFWADQLLDALSYLHSHEPPIIHRDIKPQNLKLTDENHIVLLDFGLSKNSTGQTLISSGSSAATSGSVVGYTPHYAPMEQIRGTGTSPRSDIYSFSATLYQLMTNTVPADALTRADALLNGSPDPIRPPHEINPEVPSVVSDVILKGLEVTQERRFAKAGEMQKALRKAFTKMQEAMSAKTVAFSMDAPGVAESQPIPPSMQQTEVLNVLPGQDESEFPTRITTPHGRGPNFIPVEESAHEGEVRQSDVKTEVFLAGDAPWSENAAGNSWPQDISDQDSNSGDLRDSATSGELPRESVPPADIGSQSGENEAKAAPVPEFFTTPNVGQPVDPFMTYTPARDENIEADEPQTGSASAEALAAANIGSKRGSSKTGLVIGGMMAVVVLLAVTVGAGWFVYSNYYAGTASEVTPSPEPSPITATPMPTVETVTNPDTPSSTEDLTVAPTPLPTEPGMADVQPPPTSTTTNPQVGTRRTPTRQTAGPASRPTPKPKAESNRTKILQ